MTLTQLARLASANRKSAWVPCSGYRVGAALLGASGRVFLGCNIESAVYGLTICAERVALVRALSEGESSIEALAVVSASGARMCGACRQMAVQLAPRARIWLGDVGGDRRIVRIRQIIPGAPFFEEMGDQ